MIIKKLTMSMHSHAARSDVSSDCEVRKPQVLDVNVSEGRPDGCVELSPGEHGGGWVGEVQKLLAPLGHFLEIDGRWIRPDGVLSS